MPSPQTQRSTYRDRRINVMLQEGSVTAEATAKPTRADPEIEDSNRPAGRKSIRSILYISLGTAVLCAGVMFFLLFRHDASVSVKNVPVQPVQASVAQAPGAPATLPTAEAQSKNEPVAQTASASKPMAHVAERVRFKLHRGSRSQRFGLLNLRLVSTNARRGFCSIFIATADQTASQHTIQVNRAFQTQDAEGSKISLTVSGVSRDSISGYIESR